MSDVEDGLTDDDVSLPKATIAKIIQELLPQDLSTTKEFRDYVADCCLEFVHLISSEANEISEKESKKTISGDHVLSALESLGFNEYLEDIKATLVDFQKQEKDKQKRSAKMKDSGMSVEEQERMQEELFAKAKARLAGQGGEGEP